MIDPMALKAGAKAGAWNNVPDGDLNCRDAQGHSIPDDTAREALNAKPTILPDSVLGKAIASGAKPLYIKGTTLVPA